MAPCEGLNVRPEYLAVRSNSLLHLRGLFQRYFDDVKYPGTFNMEALNTVWAPLLDRGCASMLVAFIGQEPVGVYGVTYMADTFNGERTATMVFFWVAPEARGRGIGKFLLHRAEIDSFERGCTNIVHGHMFTVEEDGGRKMFEKRGYEVVELGFRKRF